MICPSLLILWQVVMGLRRPPESFTHHDRQHEISPAGPLKVLDPVIRSHIKTLTLFHMNKILLLTLTYMTVLIFQFSNFPINFGLSKDNAISWLLNCTTAPSFAMRHNRQWSQVLNMVGRAEWTQAQKHLPGNK